MRTTAAPLLSPVTAARVIEINRTLELAEPGFAETIIAGALNSIMQGDGGLVLEGWEREHGQEWAEARLAALVEAWKAAGLETLPKSEPWSR